MNQLREITKAYKETQNFIELMSVNLINDNIDNWEITLKYPNEHKVILKFLFHLIEQLPPKATVVFPPSLKYVCFEEIGSTKWNGCGNITNLLLSLHNEYQRYASTYSINSECISDSTAQNNWEYVNKCHSDWNFKDISQLMSEMPIENITQLRTQAKKELDMKNDEIVQHTNANNENLMDITKQNTNNTEHIIEQAKNELNIISVSSAIGA